MSKFIELPRVDFQGRLKRSVFVNVEHIVSFEPAWEGHTVVWIAGWGNEGGAGAVNTILPVESLIQHLDVGAYDDTIRERFVQQYQQRVPQKDVA